ncbi:hypothetical protein EJB05_52507, partial [Eragrostis curvula]
MPARRRYWGTPYRPLLPRKAYGLAINYIDDYRPHLFSQSSSPANGSPKIDGLLSFLPREETSSATGWWSFLDHCNGLLLCAIAWESKLCACNPATRRRTRRDHAGAYLAFDPAVSPHYQVILIPVLPEAPEPKYRRKVDEELDHDPWRLMEAPKPKDCGKVEDESGDDPWRLMEWPPSTWRMNVFSSSTGQWEERAFVRKGEPAGIIQDMRLDRFEPTWTGPRQRYAVSWNGALYVHCRGSFISRFDLSKGKYQVFKTPVNYVKGVKASRVRLKKTKTPTDMKDVKPYLGRHIEWELKHEVDVGWLLDTNGRQLYGSWMVEEEEEEDNIDEDDISGTSSDEDIEWDSENDDFITLEDDAKEDYGGRVDILGFHPSKKVVFMATSLFEVAAYHLDSSKFQYLGYSRPECYYLNYSNGIYESFVYTPCMIGDLLHGDNNTRQSS